MFKNYFLKASAWQLCLMMIAPYAVYKFSNFGHNPIDWGFLAMYFLAVALGWVYSVGSTANNMLEDKYRKPALYFQVATLIPFIYVPIFVFVFLVPLSQGALQRPPQGLIFIHFISLFAAGYSVWFSAKQYTTLKNKAETSFIDYYPVFMGFWFGAIGVWFLQSGISKHLVEIRK